MEIKTEYESPLKMNNLLISECRFRRSESELKNVKIDVRFERRIIPVEDGRYKVSLVLFLGDFEKKLEIVVKCIANFETGQKNTLLIEKNAIAIMFPYVRSYITLITSQPGMSPIVLPPINVAAMFSNG